MSTVFTVRLFHCSLELVNTHGEILAMTLSSYVDAEALMSVPMAPVISWGQWMKHTLLHCRPIWMLWRIRPCMSRELERRETPVHCRPMWMLRLLVRVFRE